MSIKIFKYPIPNYQGRAARVELPEGSDVLRFARDPNGQGLAIWALVSPDAPTVPRDFEVFGTGHEIGNMTNKRYIGTCDDGPFVWHLIEILP